MKRSKQPQGAFFSDLAYLWKLTETYAARVIVYAAALVVIGIVMNFVSWIALPMIVFQTETASSPLSPLITTIVAASVLFILRFLWQYVDGLFAQSRDLLRTRGNTALAERALIMAFPPDEDAHCRQTLQRATPAYGTHIDAPIPHSWKALSLLMIHVAGTLICAAIIVCSHGWLLAVTAVTTVVRAIVHHAVTTWDHRHKGEEAALDERLARVPRAVASPRFAVDIRVFGLHAWLTAIYDSHMRAMNAFLKRRAGVYLLFTFADAVLTLLCNGAAYAVLVYQALTADMSAAAFLLYFTAIGSFTQSLSWSIDDWRVLGEQLPCVRAVRDFFAQTAPLCSTGSVAVPEVVNTLSLCDVSVSDSVSARRILSHVSLTIHTGETVAVVSENHDEATALAHLLCGLYDPDEGTVLCNAIDIRTFDRRAYYELFATALSDAPFIGATIAQIVGGVQCADKARVWECLDKVDLSGMVCALPRGIDTPVGRDAFEDGVVLSAAEAARLRLARVMYRGGPFLVVDDTASMLDPLAAQSLYDAYFGLAQKATAVFLSCHPVTARSCDRVLVLKDGAVVEDGTHEALLAREGAYARWYRAQSRPFGEGRDSV